MDFWQSLFPKANSPNEWQNWLQDYMKQSFENQLPKHLSPSPDSSSMPYTLFESFHYLFIHVEIADCPLHDVKVHHTLSHLIIRIPDKAEIKIALPCPISKKGACAEAKDGVLEISIPKSKIQFEKELPIDPID